MKKLLLCFLFSRIAHALIGGVETWEPHSVLLFINQDTVATGTLVGPRTVLMAGHSLLKRTPEQIEVHQWGKTQDGPQCTKLGVATKLKIHPLYVEDPSERKHDLALLQFDNTEVEPAGAPIPIGLTPLERDKLFRVSGHGAVTHGGKPSVIQYSGTNVLPGPQAPPLERLKSESWVREGILRFYGEIENDRKDKGERVAPASGDSGLGLIQNGEVRGVFSGAYGDIEVRKVSIAAVNLTLKENIQFLREALDDGYDFKLIENIEEAND